MKLFSGFLLVLAFLAVSACTDDDETILKQCDNGSTVNVTEGKECPPPEDTSEDTSNNNTPGNNTPGNQGGSTGGQMMDTPNKGEPGRSDCTPVQVVDLMATSQDDIICGNDRGNTIYGLAGDDTIYGGPGNDILIGGDDRDTLKGEAGNDILRGGQDNDILDGGDGTDTADYSMENATDADENGVFELTTAGMPIKVNLAEGQATDTYMDVDTLISIENVIGTSEKDTITGDENDNEIDGYGAPADDPDTLDGGAGSDTIILRGDAASFTLGADDNAKNFENITSMLTTTGEVTLMGDSGPNIIIGGVGEDTIVGGAGRDILNGGEGDDEIHNGAGVNILIGGKGVDDFMIDALDADADTIQDFTPGQDTITCVLASDEATTAKFLAISKKEITENVAGERARGEITAVTVEVRVDKKELAIYEIYSQVTTAANSGNNIDEESEPQPPRKLRTLVRTSGLSAADELTFTGENVCSRDKQP